jgi:hypothetical protein
MHPDVHRPHIDVTRGAGETHHSKKEINFFTAHEWYQKGIGFYEQIIAAQDAGHTYMSVDLTDRACAHDHR